MSIRRLKAYRFALDPTTTQLKLFRAHAGASRWAYNYALETKNEAWRVRSLAIDELVTLGYDDSQARRQVKTQVPNYIGLCAIWRAERTKTTNERRRCDWHADVSSHVFSSAFRDADRAFQAWFDSMAGNRPGRPVGRPKFKKMGRARDSFTIRHDAKKPAIRLETYRRLRIPRIGSVRLHHTAKPLSRRVADGSAVVKSVTVARGAHRWYATLLVEESISVPKTTRRQRTAGAIGVDAGVQVLAALSTGELIPNSRHGDAVAQRLAAATRKLARTQRGSHRRSRAVARLSRLHHQTAARRAASIHQITKRLATTWAVVVVEDLNLAAMSRRPRPAADPDHPGAYLPNRAAAKSGLNRVLLDAALGEMRRQLTYKSTWYGSRVVAVNSAYTSQKCAACGHVARDNRKSQAVFECVACGHQDHADVNAARNILAAGTKLAGERPERINARRGINDPLWVDGADETRRPHLSGVATSRRVIATRSRSDLSIIFPGDSSRLQG